MNIYDFGVRCSKGLNRVCFGNTDQTFSANNHERKRQGQWNLCWFIDPMFFVLEGLTFTLIRATNKDYHMRASKNHCLEAWVNWKTQKRTTSWQKLKVGVRSTPRRANGIQWQLLRAVRCVKCTCDHR